ncbi:MAG: LytR/AlgR family response regulator transcription factor [Bacillota bacterium]
MIIKTIIVEDEDLARQELKYLLEQDKRFKVIAEAAGGRRALKLLEKNEADLLFLDIKLPGISGIEVAKKIQSKNNSPLIVFTTAYDEYAVEAFRLAAVDYLLKPISEKRLNQTLDRVWKKINSQNFNKEKFMQENINSLLNHLQKDSKKPEKIAVSDGDRYLLLNYNNIFYFSTKDKKVWAHTDNNSYITQFQLKELEKILPENFYRIHKSYIVNLKLIKAVIPWFKGKYQVMMSDFCEHNIPVSRSRVQRLNELLNLK